MEYIEVTGKSVEEAITNACTKLGIPSDKLDYEVIDKGNSGFLGIFNSKPAKIKAREKQEEPVVDQKLILLRLLKSQKHLFMQKKNSKRRQMISRKQNLRRNSSLNLRKSSKRNTSLLIITRMQKLMKHLRLKHSHSLRQSHLQQNRRKLLRRIYRHSLIICLVL